MAVTNPVLNDPSLGSNAVRVGSGLAWATPMHVAQGPLSLHLRGAAYRVSMQSAQPVAAGLAAGGEMFQFRFLTDKDRICIVTGVDFSAGQSVGGAAGTVVDFHMRIARKWTGLSVAGIPAVLTGSNNKLRSSHPYSEVSINIMDTAALSAGTKTLDAGFDASVSSANGTGAIAAWPMAPLVPKTSFFGDVASGMGWPLVLESGEGFIIANGATAIDVSLRWGFDVDVQWLECESPF
jgi:hypothetical protein